MNFAFKPSLEHMALVKIVCTLWSQYDINRLLRMYVLSMNWKRIEDKVIEKVPRLFLPQLLKEKVLGMIKPIGLQIYEWFALKVRKFGIYLECQLFWTPEGTLDRKKSAEAIVKNRHYDTYKRYQLAHYFFLEEYIMPGNINESEEISRHGRYSNESEFHCAAMNYNKAALKYYLEKLTPLERGEILVETAKCVTHGEMLRILLLLMNEDQQMEVFKDDPQRVLSYFLQFPLQNFFMGVANIMWNFLSNSHFEEVLICIISKHWHDEKDYNYQMLFRQFWQNSPNALKNFVRNESDDLILLLLSIKNEENIRLIYKNPPITLQEKLIYSFKMQKSCARLIRTNEWDFFEFVIRECFPSQNEKLKFKKEFEMSLYVYHFLQNDYESKQRFDKLFLLPDDSSFVSNKRNEKGEETSSSKRIRS